MDNSRIAGFARFVVETAQEVIKSRSKSLHEAGRELGTAAVAVIEKLGLRRQKVPIGCVGSVFKAGELLTGPMIEIIAQSPQSLSDRTPNAARPRRGFDGDEEWE